MQMFIDKELLPLEFEAGWQVVRNRRSALAQLRANRRELRSVSIGDNITCVDEVVEFILDSATFPNLREIRFHGADRTACERHLAKANRARTDRQLHQDVRIASFSASDLVYPVEKIRA